jgi:hypothetical protein
VGSSKIIRDGISTISMATHTLFFSPPDIPFVVYPPIKEFSHFCNSNNFISSFTLSSANFSSLNFKTPANLRVS